ncbi:serine/threonine protein kinase [Desmospora activa]|uniref:Serine/threonine protein kinase n=1 Tax=Desmospora activa DSM 45169 TaxID=1121389 RepID=A0A2T4ZDQ0_9BACL|nr:serine/threonine protein kinase [Desmospora activa]PTM59986.1 hypothetical protein C8J48_2625 [Desmospora activa DSM 45169]
MSWKKVIPLLQRVSLEPRPDNQLVKIFHIPAPLEIVGVGTDAVVVYHPQDRDTVFKVFAPNREQVWANEVEVYHKLGKSRWFPLLKDAYPGCLVLSYERGKTLYDCLIEGIPIPESVVEEVEEARRYARDRGLNPRDIHLKNVLLQDGHAKLLDVSEYLKSGDDGRWDHMVQAYRRFYPLFRGKRIPVALLEEIKRAYREWDGRSLPLTDWARRFLPAIFSDDPESN